MKAIPLPLKKSILLLFLSVIFCIPVFSSFSSNAPYSGKRWNAIVYTGTQKVKGTLYQVSDNSVVLALPGGGYTEILFSDIHKIKLRPRFGTSEKLVGFLVGMTTGAVVTAVVVTNGGRRESPGSTLAGISGGFLGGIVGAGLGFALATPIYRLVATRRYHVQPDPSTYPLLAQKLRRRSIRR